MRNLVVSEFVTLDGVMEEPRWTVAFAPSAEQLKFKFDELFSSDALLLGRTTYQGFAAAWPSSPPDEQGYSKRMNGIEKYVVSRTLKDVGWENSRLISGDISEAVTRLKQESGQDILVFGSAQLVSLLLQQGLVDELRLLVYPVVLGSGKRLFKEGTGAKMKLIESRAFESGTVLIRYNPIR